MTDEARAIAEVAKTTGEMVKAAGGVGSYLARVFGSIPDNLLGLMVGDWLDNKRRRHLAMLEANTAHILDCIAAERLIEPSPSVLIPLLQAAVDEGRPELQALWAALLANAMIDGGRKVRRDYFEAVRQMEPVDALVLDIIARRPNPNSAADGAMPTGEDVRVWSIDSEFIDREGMRLSIQPDDMVIARANLSKLGCIVNWGGGPNVKRPPDLTAFGRSLLAACKAP
jgi:Abortive infection alpha